MDDIDQTLESLKVQIKKEIIDHYFAERVFIEEEIQVLQAEVKEYHEEAARTSRRFLALYQGLGSEAAVARVMQLLSLTEWPFYEEFLGLPPADREKLLQGRARRGFTAWRRFRNLIFDLYEELQQHLQALQEKYRKITIHLELINEDVVKFNSSFDFGLIAAQMEALEGGGEVISGGLLSTEREELSTRMRFKRQKLTEEELPLLPVLPPLERIKGQLSSVLEVCAS
ncbi:MAG: hypothetical protein AB1491_02765 [Thermodesulfobacteriota bacterium]